MGDFCPIRLVTGIFLGDAETVNHNTSKWKQNSISSINLVLLEIIKSVRQGNTRPKKSLLHYIVLSMY